MLDSEPIKIRSTNDCLGSMFGDMVSKINFKLMFFLMFIYLLITSDVFVNRILARIPDATETGTPSTYGTVVQGIFLVLFYTIADVAIKNEIV